MKKITINFIKPYDDSQDQLLPQRPEPHFLHWVTAHKHHIPDTYVMYGEFTAFYFKEILQQGECTIYYSQHWFKTE